MDRNREARRSTSMAAPNGLARRRHRTSLRDSPEEDGPMELQETTRLRDRGGSVKKDRDRTRDRDRDRDRDRLSRNKRRAERMLHGNNREDGGDETSEESVNDEEEEEDDRGGAGDVGGSGHMRLVPPLPLNYQPSSLPSSISNHSNRRSFPPTAAAAAAAKVFRPAAPWKAADEMIGVSVPRKARSASIKRSHEWLSSGGHIVSGSSGEHILGQASASPVRTNLATTASPVRPISPSSSNASGRKKMKPDGPKRHLPPKSSSKSSSSDQEEIEIEIAEVLYGMMRQPQVPSKPEVSDSMRFESSRDESRFAGDAKSRISSPIPNSPAPPHPQNSSSALTVTAPKRKKPRQVKYDDETQPTTVSARNNPISATTTKAEMDQTAKIDAAAPNLEKVPGFLKENGVSPYDLVKPAMESQLRKFDDTHELKPLRGEAGAAGKVGPPQSSSPLKESSSLRLDDNRVDSSMKATKASEIENQREERFQIDLMSPPSRSSPDRDGDVVYLSPIDPKKPLVPEMKAEPKRISNNDEKSAKVAAGREHRLNAVAEEAKSNAETHKSVLPKEKTIDLPHDLEKIENGVSAAASISELNYQYYKQQQQKCLQQQQQQALQQQQKALQQQQKALSQPVKNAQPNNPMSFPMSVAGWPGAMPPMGYMAAPLQGVVSMDGSTVVSAAAIQPPQWLFNQPRQKKCATHCYIARNIQYHQQMSRMNPYWQPATAAASASMYGGKPTNLNVVSPAELHGSAKTIRATGNSMPEMNQNMSLFPGKEKAPPAASNVAGFDASQRKQQQVLLQPSLPAGAPNNLLGPPTFIFPMSLTQQHAAAAAAAASVHSGVATAGKPNNTGATSSSSTMSTSPSQAISASAAAATATAMSFNFPNMPSGETQYLAILQNNPYPFPVPAHVGAGPQYRGNPAQPMPFFNGSFYSSQMLHPSQLQQAPNPSQQTQNASMSTSSSSSHKHPQSQQHRHQGSAGNGSLQGFPSAKHPTFQQQQQQQQQNQQQQQQNHHADGAEDGDGRASQPNMNIYAQSFPMAMHAQNFTLMQSAAAAAAAISSSPGHANEKKLPPHQQQGSKAGFDSLPSQAFAMSFASLNGGSASAQNLDMSSSSIAPNHASIMQNLPERHSYQRFAPAAAAQTVQKNFRASEDVKGGGGNDTSASAEDERKSIMGKGPPQSMGHIAFSRTDLTETTNVVDSSARTLNLGSTSARMPNTAHSSASSQQQRNHQLHQQQQLQHQQQQQHSQTMLQLQRQQQYAAQAAAAAARSKSQAVASNSSNGPNQSSQWKSSSSARGAATAASTQSQVPPTLNSSTAASIKGHSQQQSRPLQGQTQISFAAANSKAAQNVGAHAQQQPQLLPSSNQTQQAVGSPTASSMSKSAGGSPRTSATSASTGNKTPQASSLSNHHHHQQQQGKTSSSSISGHKSSPVAGNVPSMLGNSHIMSSSAAGTKHQQQQQQQQQSLQQTQMFFTHPYMQVHNPHSPSAASAAAATNAYYHGRRSSDPQQQLKQQPQQQQQQMHGTSSSGMLSLCSPTNNITCDPVKAVAASNMKSGVGHHPQGILHSAPFAVAAQASGSPHQLMPAGYSYVHTIPNAAQVKAAEQKQPAAAREESRSDN